MSKITLAPNAAGTGTLTVAAPNTSTDYTLTLPTATTTLVGTDATQTLTNKSIAGSQLTGTVAGSLLTGSVASSLLTGALPAIDGSALTGIVTGGMTLLGTLTTTSGVYQTLSGLNLTSYKEVHFSYKNVSSTWGSADQLYIESAFILQPTVNAASLLSGGGIIDLVTGVILSYSSTNLVKSSSIGISTAVTSISFNFGAGTFDNGTITIYGVK